MHLVTSPDDVSVAQNKLARYLRPMSAGNATLSGEPWISSDAARMVTSTQAGICRLLANASTEPSTRRLENFFTERAELLESVQAPLSMVVDLQARGGVQLRFWQTHENATAIGRMARDGVLAFTPSQLNHIARATHQLTHNLGTTLRRELLRSDSNLRDAHPHHADGPVRVGRHSTLDNRLTDLIAAAPPREPAARRDHPLQRGALMQSLGTTPTHAGITAVATSPSPALG